MPSDNKIHSKRYFRIFILLLIISLISIAHTPYIWARDLAKEKARARQQEINILYKQARSYYSQDQPTKAEDVFNQILEIDPEHKSASRYINKKIPVRQKQLVLIRAKSKAREEKRVRREALKMAKEEVRLRKQQERGARKKAKQEEIRAKKEKQQEINTLYKQARSSYSQGQLSNAKYVFKQILEIDPEHAKAKLYLDKKIPAREGKLTLIEQGREGY